MSDAYFSSGGGLKLKGGGGVIKKKKKKTVVEKPPVESDSIKSKEDPTESFNDSKSSAGSATMTEAERRFEETRRKRAAEKAAKTASKSHKERVAEFNAYLETLSEHHDIPRVGPG
ncbi:DUF1754-domain-containing protein [Rhizoclosmatium globosum]|uniref:DUF1754-domain-containing protein n=1 Tax=Rhizoclosmatium globosum TaxID=329046 RepID=A0A1Y2C0H8_9FUNG|nr:DUF1754-domain-containing protein [Rhizoclosmatium globosum]|eukprot:ORY40520.1 DUF1754-domain-containing protein [Rhizoclosmatium globosum]